MIQRDGDWWVGWVEEIPGANAQEQTKEELIESLKEAVIDILALRCEEARKQATHDELLAEVMEDVTMVHAIQEGETTRPVSKQEVLKLLDEST